MGKKEGEGEGCSPCCRVRITTPWVREFLAELIGRKSLETNKQTNKHKTKHFITQKYHDNKQTSNL